MLKASNFDLAYCPNQPVIPQFQYTPACNPPACFVGSYPPVTPAGQIGPFFVNTYFLRPDRRVELAGPVPVRCKDLRDCDRRRKA